jgi:hypothetical protein
MVPNLIQKISMLVFIDESGDHNLDIFKADNTYNVFVLGAVLIDEKAYQTFNKKLTALKTELFGDNTFIIHTREMTRPNRAKDPRNFKLVNPDFRYSYYSRLNELIHQTQFKLIASVIQKNKITNNLSTDTKDPYLFSFDFVLNRVLVHCQNTTCYIYPEKRTTHEDTKLELALLRVKSTGTKKLRGAEVSKRISEFTLTDKSANLSGLQLADLVVTPIGRHFIGKNAKPEGNEIAYKVVKEKIQTKDLLIFP